MSLAQSSYSSPSLKPSSKKINRVNSQTVAKISFQKYGKSIVPLFSNDQKSRSISGKTSFLFNDFPYFPSPHHPLEAELPRLLDDEPCYDEAGGIGIVKFFQGKNIFITGGTGLVGKGM